MRPLLRACTLSLALCATTAVAGPQLSSQQCGFSTPYDVRVDRDGVLLRQADGKPSSVLIHDGALQVDGVTQRLTAADVQRLRRIEQGAQAAMPEVAGIAREAVGITFDAFGGVVEAITGSRSKARKMDRHRDAALAHLDRTLGRGLWQQEPFDEKFEAEVSAAAEEMAGALTRGVMWAIFTGGTDGIDKRTAALEQEMDRRMEARGKALEARADALCAKIATLDALEEQLDYRLPDGGRLELLEHSGTPGERAMRGTGTVAETAARPGAPH